MEWARMSESLPIVAHLVTPYLFRTGPWIHVQLLHNRHYRSIVMTQKTENLNLFSFSPIHDFSDRRSGLGALSYYGSKYVLGRYPCRPYRETSRREGNVLFHAHTGWEGARTVHLRRALGIPHITSFYGRDASVLPRKAYWRALYKKLFREGDLFLAEGAHMRDVLVRIGCPREKIRVVHLGVDLSRIPFAMREPGRDGEVVGLIAASLREKKGIPYALEAVARVAPRWPALRIRVVGDGPMRRKIEERIKRPDLTGKVELLGYRDFDFYVKELGRAHFLLSPSVTARDGDCEGGAPVCLIDAQAAGLPILATTHCDIPEVTVPNGSALLAAERDVEELAENLDVLLEKPDRWAEMGRVGRAHVESEFDIRKQTDRIAEIYDEILSGRGKVVA
jgi:colanic acid/amylovoran biosynthesis glycosyltransferase